MNFCILVLIHVLVVSFHIKMVKAPIAASNWQELGLCDGDKMVCPPGAMDPVSPTTIYLGEQQIGIVLPCRALANPNVRYSWYKNKVLLQPTEYMKIDRDTGDLSFPEFTEREDGNYSCAAENEITDVTGKVIIPVRFFPPITVIRARIVPFHYYFTDHPVVKEGEYAMLECGYKEDYRTLQEIHFNWIYKQTTQEVKMDNDRLYVDTRGNLHFTYTRRSDSGHVYMCHITGHKDLKLGRLSADRTVTVHPVSIMLDMVPVIKYKNHKVKVYLHTDAVLECVFHAYDGNAPYFTKIRWYHEDGEEIETTRVKYILKDFSRRLYVLDVTMEDEKNYYCQAMNGVGHSTQEAVFLDVISRPLFVPEGELTDQTIKANSDAIFDCNAASLPGDPPVQFPVWYINDRMESPQTAHTRFEFSNGHTRLTFKSVVPVTDTLCVHCVVQNEFGSIEKTGCLQVVPSEYWPRMTIIKNGVRHPDTDQIFLREGDELVLNCGYEGVVDASARPKISCDFDAHIYTESDARIKIGTCPLNGRTCMCTGHYGWNYWASVYLRLLLTPQPDQEPYISVIQNKVLVPENPLISALDGDALEITCAIRSNPVIHHKIFVSCDFPYDAENMEPKGVLKLVAKKKPMHMRRCYCSSLYGCNVTITREVLFNITYVVRPKMTLEPHWELARQSCNDGFLEDVDQLMYIGTVDLTQSLVVNRKLAVVIEIQAPGQDFVPFCRVDIYFESCGQHLAHKECYCSVERDYVFTILVNKTARSSLTANKIRMHWPEAASVTLGDVSDFHHVPKIYAQYNITLQQNTSFPVDLSNCILTMDEDKYYQLTLCVSNMDFPQISFRSNQVNVSVSEKCLSVTLKVTKDLLQSYVTFLLADDHTCDRTTRFDCLIKDNAYLSMHDLFHLKISKYIWYVALGIWVVLVLVFCFCFLCCTCKGKNKK